MMETQQQDIGEQLQQAVLQAAMPADDIEIPTLGGADQQVSKNGEKTGKHALTGPGPGRPKGVRNKLTNLRDAVLEAFDQVGGAQYLARLAEGTSSDRAAFVSLVSKVLPTQINAQVEGGVQIQLSWLAARQIGTTVAQQPEVVTQVVDLERKTDGTYRIIDPTGAPAGGAAAAGATDEKGAGGADGA